MRLSSHIISALLLAISSAAVSNVAAQDLFVGDTTANNRTNLTSGTNSYSNTYVGYDSTASNNLLTVSNTGTLLTNSGNLVVGNRGSSNSLVVSDGGAVNAFFIAAGFQTGANHNQVLVESNSTITVTDKFDVGHLGSSNSLIITNGGKVFIGADGSSIGSFTSTGNSVLITGGGSLLSNSGVYYVGYQGAGNQLTLSNQGSLISGSLAVGGSVGGGLLGSNNTVLVTSNASMTVNGEFFVGREGAFNSMTVSGGGTVTTGEGFIGYPATSSNNSVLVTGAGSRWTNAWDLYVGISGSSNSLVISNGGLVANAVGFIGNSATSSNNSVMVTGNSSLWTNSGLLYVGWDGSNNSLVISNGGMVANNEGYIGYSATSSNSSVLVTGTNSRWTNAGDLYVGYEGSGSLTIANSGSVAASSVTIAASSNTLGTLNIGSYGGSDSAGTIGAPTITFGSGVGFLNFNQAGSTTISAAITSATNSTYAQISQLGSGTTILTGQSTSNTTALLVDGGSLQLNGASFANTNGTAPNPTDIFSGGIGATVVGFSNSNVSLVLTNGSSLSSYFLLAGVGYNLLSSNSTGTGNNLVLITSNSTLNGLYGIGLGLMSSNNSLVISNQSTANGSIGLVGSSGSGNKATVTGAGSTWNVGDFGLYVGVQGSTIDSNAFSFATNGSISNSLVIANGGRVTTASNTWIGYASNDTGNSIVVTGSTSGSNSTFHSKELYVGYGGSSNSLVISNGGAVAVRSESYIGFNTNSSNNSVLVTGSNSLWSNSGNLAVGMYGSGNKLTVADGGTVANSNGGIGYDLTSSNNSVLVTGAGSSWTNSSDFGIGVGGSSNSLVISDGGTVANSNGAIGGYPGSSNNSVLVTGSNSLWTNSGNLYVGFFGSINNTLTVADGGTVAASSITIATWAGSSTLNIGTLGGSDGAGSITAPTIAFGSGTGTINFNQTNSFTLSSIISGTGTVQHLGTGTTILSGNNNYTGTTLISSGTLQAASTNAFGTSAVTLTNTGTLSLSTNLTISSLIWSGGSSSIAISNLTSGTFLNITGALSLTGSGTGTFDLSGNTLGANAVQLMAWGTSNSYTTANFSVTGLSGYQLSISNNALWIATIGDLYVGSNSTVSATNFTSGTNSYGNTYVGFDSTASNNLLTVGNLGTVLTNTSALFAGYSGASNTMIVSNGGSLYSSNATIGVSASSSNNNVIVGGVGSSSLWSNVATLNVGYKGAFNTLEILSNGTVKSGATWIGGESTAVGNSVLLNGGLLTNSSSLVVGYGGGSNSLVISNGTAVNGQGYIGFAVGADGNSVLVTGSNSLWKNTGTLNIGADASGNALVVSNGGKVTVTGADALLGYGTDSSNNSLTITGAGSSFSNNTTLLVGNAGSGNSLQVLDGGLLATRNARIGGTNVSSASNVVTISGSGSVWTNSGTIQVGSVGSDNSLFIAYGGIVRNAGDFWMGYTNSASNNNVVVDGAGSQLAVGGGVVVGRYGGANTLTIANGGTVSSVEGIELGASNGATGTLNIGLVSDDDAGALNVLALRFGTGGGVVNFNQRNAFALTNLLVGNGSLNQLGTGTTTISGSNTYTGTTLINSGSLQANSSHALGTSSVTLTNSGKLVVNSILTIASLNWASTNATIALLGSANFLDVTGGITLSGPTNTFDLTGFTLSNGPTQILAFNSNSLTTGQFSVIGVDNYMLSISNNSLWVMGGLNARTNNTIVTNSSSYTTVTFQTNGILTITQGADLTITTPVDATNNGTVVINGTLNAPALIIPIGGTLMGTGTYTGGNLIVNGTIAPGNSPGTFFVSGGNLLMGASSVWDQQIYSASVYDRVVVTGSAILNGTMNITTFGNGGLQFGQKFNFLTASGGISGAFSSIIAPEGFRGRLLLSGNNTEANILIAPASYTQLAANRNQSNVATALNSFIPYTSGDQQVVSTSLDSLTASQYNQAFNAIMPTFYQQIATIAFNNANAQNMQLVQRLWGLRVAEGGGFSMSGLSDNMPLLEGQGDGKGVQDFKKDILRPGLDNHWGMFVDGNGIFAQANSGNMLPGYNSQSGGVTTGLTYKWNENVGTGIYCGYQGTYTKSGADGSGLGTGSRLIDNAVRFGVFGTYGQKDGKGLFVNALAGGGYHNFQATRVIQYAGMNRTANSAPGAGELDTMLAAGYDIKKDKFTFGPTASLQYTYLGVNSLNETGAQSLSFNSGGWNSSSMLSSVGAHAAYSWVANKNVVVVPQVNLSWQHEFMQNPYAISGNLGGTSPTFSNWSATPIRDFLYTGVGFTVEFAKRWNTSFFYNAAAGNSDLVSQNIFWSAGVKF